MTRHAAVIVIAAVMAAIVGAVASWSGMLGGWQQERTFNLTGVGHLGRWTLEPVTALNYAWKDFAPATIFVQTGDEVVIHLRSADVFHRFYLPAFSIGPVDVEPGHTVTVRFKATRAGAFQYYCTAMCGACHFQMRGWVVVTDPGDRPSAPPALALGRCPPRGAHAAGGGRLVDKGAFLYSQKGCVTCHGPDGRGGVTNENSVSRTVPRHDTTAQKLFLRSREDADAFIGLVEASGNLDTDAASVAGFPIVRARFLNAKEIIRSGRFPAGADRYGPQPPLQMPAWKYLLEEREIDALLVYFISLYDWDADPSSAAPN